MGDADARALRARQHAQRRGRSGAEGFEALAEAAAEVEERREAELTPEEREREATNSSLHNVTAARTLHTPSHADTFFLLSFSVGW